MVKQVYMFGDSITYGAIDREGGWAARLRKWLDGRMIDSNLEEFCLTYNLGISGNTSTALLERFEREIGPRFQPENENVVIFAIGINDSQYVGTKEKPKIPLEVFKQNISKLYEQAAALSAQILFVGLTNVDESKTMPVSWNKDSWFTNESVRVYNDEIKKFCEAKKVPFVDLQGVIGPDELADGLHPNTAGHEKIFTKIKRFFEDNKLV